MKKLETKAGTVKILEISTIFCRLIMLPQKCFLVSMTSDVIFGL